MTFTIRRKPRRLSTRRQRDHALTLMARKLLSIRLLLDDADQFGDDVPAEKLREILDGR